MNTYFIKTNYFATGEGVTTFYAFGHGIDQKDFINKCKKEIDPYYLYNMDSNYEKNVVGDIFCSVNNIPAEILKYLEKDLPILYRIIEGGLFMTGNVWFVQKVHINLS